MEYEECNKNDFDETDSHITSVIRSISRPTLHLQLEMMRKATINISCLTIILIEKTFIEKWKLDQNLNIPKKIQTS